MISGNPFTPCSVFGMYWKLGQLKLIFCVDCTIRPLLCKIILGLILPSNELHPKKIEEREKQPKEIAHPSTGSSHPSTCSSHPNIGEIAPTQPHRHAPPLHVSDPPPPSSKLPSFMSSNPHLSYPSTHITQSPFRQTHTHPI